MPRVKCPNCRKTLVVMSTNMDVICNCQSGQPVKATTQEDILKLGKYEDKPFFKTGNSFSLIFPVVFQTRQKGPVTNFNIARDNKLLGTEAGICGAKSFDRTKRGNIKSLYRQRDKLEFIDLRKQSNCGDDKW